MVLLEEKVSKRYRVLSFFYEYNGISIRRINILSWLRFEKFTIQMNVMKLWEAG